MNDEQLDKLWAAARRAAPDSARVEFGFEARLLARLRARPEPWWRWGWRLLPGLAALVVALGVWHLAATANEWPVAADDAVLLSYLTGD